MIENKTILCNKCLSQSISGLGNVYDSLEYFETLKVTDLNHRTKRSTGLNPSSQEVTEVNLATLGRYCLRLSISWKL